VILVDSQTVNLENPEFQSPAAHVMLALIGVESLRRHRQLQHTLSGALSCQLVIRQTTETDNVANKIIVG